MARWKPVVTEEWIKRRIAVGYGRGEGADYKPWLVVQSFSSRGRVHRIKGWKHGRVHHLFSDRQRSIFLYYQWSRAVVDIREPYPLLPVEETVEIARDLGVKHPLDPTTKHPIVMTTGFLLTVNEGTARVFHPRDLRGTNDPAAACLTDRVEIARRYWAATPRNRQMKVVTSEHVSEDFVRNMLWLSPCYRLSDLYPLVEQEIKRIASTLTALVLVENLPLCAVAQRCDRMLGLEAGTGFLVIRHLLAVRHWEVDVNKRINPFGPLKLVNKPTGDLYTGTEG